MRTCCASSPGRRSTAGTRIDRRYMDEADWTALRRRQALDAERLVSEPNVLPGDLRNRALYRSAFAYSEGLTAYADAIPPEEELEQVEEVRTASGSEFGSELRRQAQLTVLAFKTGVSVSADLWLGGFDTHATHDPDHEWLLGNLTDSVDYLWDYAEEHGIADRMVVVMGSDFGRTNLYNSSDGKDHWPIGSLCDHGEGAAVDEPGGGRDGWTAFRAENQCDHAGARRHQRHDHLPQACPQGATPVSWHREHAGGTTVPIQQHRGLRVFRVDRRSCRPGQASVVTIGRLQ